MTVDAHTLHHVVYELVLRAQRVKHVDVALEHLWLYVRRVQIAVGDGLNRRVCGYDSSVFHDDVEILNRPTVLAGRDLAHPPVAVGVYFDQKERIAVMMLGFDAQLLLQIVHLRDSPCGVNQFYRHVRHRRNRPHLDLRMREDDAV